MTSWSLTAECSHCGSFGTVDDITLVCVRCGQTHELTPEQRQARDADIALQKAPPPSPHLARHRSSMDIGAPRVTHVILDEGDDFDQAELDRMGDGEI